MPQICVGNSAVEQGFKNRMCCDTNCINHVQMKWLWVKVPIEFGNLVITPSANIKTEVFGDLNFSYINPTYPIYDTKFP